MIHNEPQLLYFYTQYFTRIANIVRNRLSLLHLLQLERRVHIVIISTLINPPKNTTILIEPAKTQRQPGPPAQVCSRRASGVPLFHTHNSACSLGNQVDQEVPLQLTLIEVHICPVKYVCIVALGLYIRVHHGIFLLTIGFAILRGLKRVVVLSNYYCRLITTKKTLLPT